MPVVRLGRGWRQVGRADVPHRLPRRPNADRQSSQSRASGACARQSAGFGLRRRCHGGGDRRIMSGSRRTGPAWRSDLHVPGRRRPDRGERLSRDRTALPWSLLPLRCGLGASARGAIAGSRSLCCGRKEGTSRVVEEAVIRCSKAAVTAEVAMPTLIFGVVVLVLILWVLNVISKVDPKVAARVTKVGGGMISLGFAVFLGLRGEIGIAIPLGVFGLGLLGWVPFGPAGFTARTQKSGGQTSQVRSPYFEMELEHD